jgi:uncharacterized membrane protein YeaQ/YmgE (transglycosylase-associated protein family)
MIAQSIPPRRYSYEWLAVAAVAFVGGLVAGGYLGSATEWGLAMNELYVFPAIIGGVVVGAVVKLVMLYLPREEMAR